MNLNNLINTKSFYRITGTPENFLTAIRYKVWGFNENNVNNWRRINPGDVIFFHSKGADSKFIKRTKSCVVGFAVVGSNFFIDKTKLWIDEHLENKSYPYKFSFSEIYLFNEISINDTWDSTSLNKEQSTINEINKLTQNGIPLKNLDFGENNKFPHMSSYSEVHSDIVKREIIKTVNQLFYYEGDLETSIINKSTELQKLSNKNDQLRYATSLLAYIDIKAKIFNKQSHYTLHNIDKLSRSEIAHFNILSYLKDLFEKKGYDIYFNNHVDLYAINEEKSFLIEAKSVENDNFRSQTRKAISQIFEYNYFEINKFKKDKSLKIRNENSILVTSRKPEDEEYIKFVNSLNIKTAAVFDNRFIEYGDSINLINL